MNRIKDFFYDKNDIIVAVIILIAAAMVIYIRVDKIMDYPQTLLDSSAAQETVQQETESTDSSPQQAEQDTTMKSIEISDTPVAATVAKQLEAAGVIPSAKEFEADLAKYKMSDHIQPGAYQFPANMTNEQVIEVITGEKL